MDKNAFSKSLGDFEPLEKYPGQYCFVPSMLPNKIDIDNEIAGLLAQANLELGRLDTPVIGRQMATLFTTLASLIQKSEAVFSSRIEGTKSTLSDILIEELSPEGNPDENDAKEVLNNAKALTEGSTLVYAGNEVDIKMLLHLHKILTKGVRGSDSRLEPGKLRSAQNWIVAAPLRKIEDATYIPPKPEYVKAHLENLLTYMTTNKDSLLIKIALTHYKFEAIHPFADGNGRIGRLLIILYLLKFGALHAPLLSISSYIEKRKTEYYDLLLRVSTEGDYKPWLKFFLNAIITEAKAGRDRIDSIVNYRVTTLDAIEKRVSGKTIAAFELLFKEPIINVSNLAKKLGVSYVGAYSIIKRLENEGILTKYATGKKKPRLYVCESILRLLSK